MKTSWLTHKDKKIKSTHTNDVKKPTTKHYYYRKSLKKNKEDKCVERVQLPMK